MTQTNRCFTAAKLNGLELKNRLIKAGTFEGMTPNGTPSKRYQDFHTALAKGGIGMTTLGYCATEPNGRLHENMLHMNEYLRQPLSNLIEQLHQLNCKVSGQMGHCGGFTKNAQLSTPRAKGPSFGLNKLGLTRGMVFVDAMSEQDINQFIDSYARAARFMKSVGFDCLEIHFGHGYGLFQYLSPLTNRRSDQYGGSLENRMRVPLLVLEAVRKEVGDAFPIIGKISASEGARGGLNYTDAVTFCSALDNAGIDGIITSNGTSTAHPMLIFHGDSILPSLLEHEKNLAMRAVMHLVGPRMFKPIPYHELYLLEHAKRIRDAVQCKMIYVGGASSNESFETLMNEGFDFIQLGRALLSDPELPNMAATSPNFKSRCLHCNDCVGTIDHPQGIHCPRFEKAF